MALLRTRTLVPSVPFSVHSFMLGKSATFACACFPRIAIPISTTVFGSNLPKFVPRSSITRQSNVQGIHSQTMDNTVPSIVVYVTVPNREEGRKLAQSIIKEKLAACVNSVPGIESTYWWNDKIETDSEELLIIKTRQSLLETLTAHVKANHPYEVCEVIASPIIGGNHDYLKWLKESTKE